MPPFVRRAASFSLGLTLVLTAATVGAQDAEPPRPPPPPPVVAAPVAVSPHVWVTLGSTGHEARLEGPKTSTPVGDGDESDDDRWTKVCDAPCGIWVPPNTKLRVNGDFRSSAPFVVPARPAVAITATPPDRGAKTGAIALTAASGAALGLTLGLAFFTNLQIEEDRRSTSEKHAAERRTTLLLLGTGVSAGGLITGLLLLRNVNKTTVELGGSQAPNAGGPRTLPLARGLTVSPAGVHF